MNERQKPLVWTWPPARKGNPSPGIHADMAADPEIKPPAQEAASSPEKGEEAMQIPVEMAENTVDQPVEEQEAAAESAPLPDEEERIGKGSIPSVPPATGGANNPDMDLAKAYIPYQIYGLTYSPREALERGTLFPALYRPYPNSIR